MKPLTCNEIIQFLILAGKNKSSNRNGSKQIPTTLCPNFSISWPSERWINHSDTLEDNSHIAGIPGFFHGYIFLPLKLMSPNSSAHELFAVQIMTILFQIKSVAAAGKKRLWEHQSVEHIFELDNLSGPPTVSLASYHKPQVSPQCSIICCFLRKQQFLLGKDRPPGHRRVSAKVQTRVWKHWLSIRTWTAVTFILSWVAQIFMQVSAQFNSHRS